MDKLNRRQYEDSKKIVKKWEKEFTETARRTPKKSDIKCAPENIKEAYKTYWKLKMTALETSLSEIADENAKDCFNSSGEKTEENSRKTAADRSINEDSRCFAPVSELSSSQLDEGNSRSRPTSSTWWEAKSGSNLLKDKSAELNFKDKIVKKGEEEFKIWGEHLNKRKVDLGMAPSTSSKLTALKQTTLTEIYAEKIRRNATFKKLRNPTKPFVKSYSTGSFEIRKTPEVVAFSSNMFEESGAFQLSSKDEPNLGSSLSSVTAKIVTKTLGPASQPLSVVQTLSSDRALKTFTKTVDQGWLDRVTQSAQGKNETASQDSGIGEFTQGKRDETAASGNFSDEDCIITDSDSESQAPPSHYTSNLANSEPLPSSTSWFDKAEPPDAQSYKKAPEMSKTKRIIDETELPSAKKSKLDELFDESVTPTCSTKLEIVQASKKSRRKPPTPKRLPSAEERKKIAHLERKLASGKANENFVAINIEKKVFVRGQKKGTYTKYKKKMWKDLKKENMGTSGLRKCFSCGDVGHFSKSCPKAGKECLGIEDCNSEDESPFPTLEQVSQMAREAGDEVHKGKRKFTVPIPQPDEQETASRVPPPDEDVPCDAEFDLAVGPLYPLKEDGSLKETTDEVYDMLRKFGHSSFLEGQEEAVMRILSGKSTLVTMSTGSGKSLCYQIPAALHHKIDPTRITLVISPLVSLMEDQVNGACGWKDAACYHTNMTQIQRKKVIERIKGNELAALLVSPETLVSFEDSRHLFSALRSIAFACVDEAHCLHQWCNNFRPSYLTVTQVLREKLKVKTILGLTATASRDTVDALKTHLGIDPEDASAVISDRPVPDNLLLTVTKIKDEQMKQVSLLKLLNSDRFGSSGGIIVYCTRRDTCDQLARFLRASLQDECPQTNGRISHHVEAYHAGLTPHRRSSVQKAFMSGNLRIVVATVAFGMGINKADTRGIIHYNIPPTFENYVQEVGRAGRDGKPAQCHLLLTKKDLAELKRFIYADTIDRHVLRKLLELIFIPCQCPPGRCAKHEVAFPIEDTVQALDIPQENVSTLLAYLELDEAAWIKVLPLSYSKGRVSSYKGPNHLKCVAKTCPPLAVAWAEAERKGKKDVNTLEFDIFELARKINWDSGTLKHTLSNLEWTRDGSSWKKSGISVDFSCLCFRVLAPGNLPVDQLDKALDVHHATVLERERSRLATLQHFFSTLSRIAFNTLEDCSPEAIVERSDTLKEEIRRYFSDNFNYKEVELIEEKISDESYIAGDICSLISTHHSDNNFTGRTIARILHGIFSPNFPAIVWGRTRFWRLHIGEDFNALCRLATRQLLRFK